MRCNSTVNELYSAEHWCPGRITFCDAYPDRTGLALGRIPTYPSLVSCSFSVLGSLLIVFSYLRWKDLRTGSRSIITFLSIADFFTAAGYIVAGGNYLYHYDQPEATLECVRFQQICEMQSFLTSWSSLASFVWTSILAIYLYLTVVRQRTDWAARLIPAGHVIAWVLPFAIIYPLLCKDRLGFTQVASSNWCYIKGRGIQQQPAHFRGKIPTEITILVLIAGKLWEIISYIVVLVFYTLIKYHIRKEARQGTFLSDNLRQAALQIDRKLTFIPMVFILLRMWGTIQFIYTLIVSRWIECGCVSEGVWKGFFALGLLQAVGDGGQGWGNAVLYVFTSKVLRERLFSWLYKPLFRCLLCKCLRRTPRASEETTLHHERTSTITDQHQHHSTNYSPPKGTSRRGGGTVMTWLHRNRELENVSFDNVAGGRIVFESPGRTRYTPPKRGNLKGKRSTYVEYEPTTLMSSDSK